MGKIMKKALQVLKKAKLYTPQLKARVNAWKGGSKAEGMRILSAAAIVYCPSYKAQMGGVPHQWTSLKFLARHLEVEAFDSEDEQEAEEEPLKCGMCFEDVPVLVLDCTCHFTCCDPCLTKWLKEKEGLKKCPGCRGDWSETLAMAAVCQE